MVGDQREIRSDGLANGKLERTAYHGSQDTSMLSRSDAHPVHAVRFGARGSAWSYPSGFNQSPAAPSAPWRCWAAAAVWSGPRAAESRFVPFSEAQRSGKTGAAIPRGESGLCDPRRSQTTTGASVRLTSVAQAHPYSPRHRAERGYEPRRFSGPRKPAADGQCRRGAFQGGPQSGPRRGCGPQPKNAAAPGARNRGVGGVTRRGPCAVIASSPRYQLGPDRVDGAMSRRTDS